ncbi:hypothetical protein D3C80_1623830 [compost metagenome]
MRVVGVGADKDLVVLVVDGRSGQARHFTDHADFVPGGDHDGQRFFRDFVQALLIGPFELAVDAKTPDQRAPPIAQIDEQVVQPQQEHQRGKGDRQELQAEQQVSEKIDEYQAHVSATGRAEWAIVLSSLVPSTKVQEMSLSCTE